MAVIDWFSRYVLSWRLAVSLESDFCADNVLYCGEVRHKGKVYPGEQAAIVNRQIWQQAQALLRQTKGGERVRKRPLRAGDGWRLFRAEPPVSRNARRRRRRQPG